MLNLLNSESAIYGKMKRTIPYITFYFLLYSIFFGGCGEMNEIYIDNREIEREIKHDPYNYVRIWSVGNIKLVEDTVCKTVVKGKKSVVSNINFKQEDGKIFVREKGHNKWNRGVEKPLLEFHFKSLNYFRIEEPAHLWSTDTVYSQNLKIIAANELSKVDLIINTESFYFENWSNNTGNYKFAGKSNRFHIKLYGSARLRAENLNTSHAVIEQHSIANGYLSVKDTLEVYTKSKGDIYYSGDPQKIIFEQDAPGELIKTK